MDEPTTAAVEATNTAESERALVLRPPTTLMPPPVAPAQIRLPGRLARHLPALWNGGRGPLARAAVAGGLVALGAVVGRMATTSAVAIVPTGRGLLARPPGPPRRVTVTIEAEIGERTTRAWGRTTTRWGRRRVQVVQDYDE
ncbi:MAG: hypothetical protein IT340_13630 [Chloroflexi bacterium]|nr:hypothetical protein [Chloroflexota bacterium]